MGKRKRQKRGNSEDEIDDDDESASEFELRSIERNKKRAKKQADEAFENMDKSGKWPWFW